MSTGNYAPCAHPGCKILMLQDGQFLKYCKEHRGNRRYATKRAELPGYRKSQQERYELYKDERNAAHEAAGGQVTFECNKRCKFWTDCCRSLIVEKRDWDPFCFVSNPRHVQFVQFVKELHAGDVHEVVQEATV